MKKTEHSRFHWLERLEARVAEAAGANQGQTLGIGDAGIALAATALAFLILVISALAGQESSPQLEGTLVAAFVTKTEIVLCSDGRVVNSSDGAVVRDDWSKVHQLNDRIGLLTAGRDLPGFTQRARVRLSRQTSTSMTDTVNTIRVALQEEWASLAIGSAPTQGRAFVFVAGFDENGAPRLFHFDSQSSPAFKINEMPLFTVSRDLEIGAIATGMEQQDPAATIVKYLDGLQKGQPALGLHRLLLGAFNATKAELGSRNTRIGGLTFAATIDLTNGFRAITAW